MAFDRLESRYFVQFENRERDRLEKVGDFCLCPARSLLGYRKVTYYGEGIGTHKIAALTGSIILFILSLPLLPIGLICTAYSGTHQLKYADVQTYFGQSKTLEYDRVTRFHDLIDDVSGLDDEFRGGYFKSMDQMILVYPDGYRLKLDTKSVPRRPRPSECFFEIEQLSEDPTQEDQQQIFQILREADSYSDVRAQFRSLFPNCLVAREEKGSSKIIGVLAYKAIAEEIYFHITPHQTIETKGYLHVTFLAKRLEYGKLGVGAGLFSEIEAISRVRDYRSIRLHVRAGNPALAFYRDKIGMHSTETKADYYSDYPCEDGLLMEKWITS